MSRIPNGPGAGFDRGVQAIEQAGRRHRHSRDGHVTFSCPGPSHANGDRNPSGSLTRGPDGAGIHCHGGCPPESIAEALGFDLRDLFDVPKEAVTHTFPPDTSVRAAVDSATWMSCRERGHRVVAAYNYTTAGGTFLAQKLRCDSKDFAWRRLDRTSRNGWRYNRQGVDVRLYRPDVIRWAIDTHQVIYLTEGEKCADAFHARKIPATTSPDGAWTQADQRGKWRPEYTEMLRGADLTIVADRDAQGKAHAENVATAVIDVVHSLEIVYAATDKDAADHFAAGYSLVDFISWLTPKPYVLDMPDDVPAEIEGSGPEAVIHQFPDRSGRTNSDGEAVA